MRALQPVHWLHLQYLLLSRRCPCARREVLKKIRPLRALSKRRVLLNS